jgi:hypothetical protein
MARPGPAAPSGTLLRAAPGPHGTHREQRIPVVDPWQAALDIAGDPKRGWDQAEAIAKRFVAMADAR